MSSTTMKRQHRSLALLIAFVTLNVAPIARADIVTDWNATIRAVMQQDGTHPVHSANPGWSTRSIAMMNGAIYDTFQAIDRTHRPFMADMNAASGTSLDAAVNQAAFDVLMHCYGGEGSMLQSAYDARMAAIPDSPEKTAGIALGQSIAHYYKVNRAGDRSDESFPYTPGTNPGEWRPRPGQDAWGPGWGTVSPFVMPSSEMFVDQLPALPALNSAEYTAAYNQVKDLGALNSPSRTAEQTEIGIFWAYDRPSMGPPPVLFVSNLEQIAAAVGTSPSDNARLFAMASMAQADAAIAAWDAKFRYNFWRPIAGVHEGDTDGNPDTIGDPTWQPLGAPGNDPNGTADDFTPPFPAWTSGHATMGAAWFKAVELFFGTNDFATADALYGIDPVTGTYTLTSQEEGGGGARIYHTFAHEGDLILGMEDSPDGENAASRIYLGVHWIMDQRDGVTLGHNIANYVSANHFAAVPEPSTSVLVATAMGAAVVMCLRRRRKRRLNG
jgi:hypothetical protein